MPLCCKMAFFSESKKNLDSLTQPEILPFGKFGSISSCNRSCVSESKKTQRSEKMSLCCKMAFFPESFKNLDSLTQR